METFRKWITDEIPEALEKQIWDLPVVKNLPPDRTLKTLRLMDVIEGEKVERGQAFRKLGPLVRLRPPDPTSLQDAWLRNYPTRLNWLPRIRGIAGADRQIISSIGEAGAMPNQKLSPFHVALLDIDDLLFELEGFKATRGLDRLHADRSTVLALLAPDVNGWYELLATADDMRTDRYANRVQWQRMAQQMLNAYAERFYRFVRGRWEAPYLVVGDIDESDFEGRDYTIETTELVRSADEIEQIAEFVQDLKETLEANALATWSQWGGHWRTVPFSGHLYQPLLYVGKNRQIKISPVPLDKHEAQFVQDLAVWCAANAAREVYLLRNQAVTGLGFFQASNFFPDFLLWVQDSAHQHLAFVDPKGLHHFDPADPKMRFATQDITVLQSIVAQQTSGIRLHAFILSNTPFASVGWSAGTTELMTKAQIEELGVLFQADDAATYISSMMTRITGPARSSIADPFAGPVVITSPRLTDAERLVKAFVETRDGRSPDFVVADPITNANYRTRAKQLGVGWKDADLNRWLLNARKTNQLTAFPTEREYRLNANYDPWVFASEWGARETIRQLSERDGHLWSLDDVLCDPGATALFDDIVQKIKPGFERIDYHWAALSFRKRSTARRAVKHRTYNDGQQTMNSLFGLPPAKSGIYRIVAGAKPLFVSFAKRLDLAIGNHRDLAGDGFVPEWLRESPSIIPKMAWEENTKMDDVALLDDEIHTRKPWLNLLPTG